MLAEKVLQFKLSAAHSVSIPTGKARALLHTVLLGRTALFCHDENNGLQDSPRAGCPFVEGGD